VGGSGDGVTSTSREAPREAVASREATVREVPREAGTKIWVA
jgi:hypothetical protein